MRTIGLGIGVSLFIALLAAVRFFSQISFDESYYLWHGWMILKGFVPYRDLFEPKPPVIFFANALGLGLFGFPHGLYRILPTALACGSLLSLFLAMIRQKILPVLAAILTAQVACWLLGSDFHDSGLNDTETYGLALSLLGLGFSWIGASLRQRKWQRISWFFGGGCLGLAILSKELFLLSVVPIWFLSSYEFETGNWRTKQLIETTVGTVGVGFVTLLYLMMTSSFLPYLHLMQFYRSFAANYCVDIGVFPKLGAWGTFLESCRRLTWILYDFQNLIGILPFFVVMLWALRKHWVVVIVLIASVGLGAFSVGVGHCFWRHYYLMGVSGLLLCAAFGAWVLSVWWEQKRFRFRQAWRAVFVLLGIHLMASLWHAIPQKRSPEGLMSPGLIAAVEKYSQPRDFIFSSGSPLIYVVTDRMPPLGTNTFLDELIDYLLPGATDPERFEGLSQELDAHLPQVCYFPLKLRSRQKRHWDSLFQPFLQRHGYQKITEEIWVLGSR